MPSLCIKNFVIHAVRQTSLWKQRNNKYPIFGRLACLLVEICQKRCNLVRWLTYFLVPLIWEFNEKSTNYFRLKFHWSIYLYSNCTACCTRFCELMEITGFRCSPVIGRSQNLDFSSVGFDFSDRFGIGNDVLSKFCSKAIYWSTTIC